MLTGQSWHAGTPQVQERGRTDSEPNILENMTNRLLALILSWLHALRDEVKYLDWRRGWRLWVGLPV